jgi:hypothetical protein
VVLVVAAKHLVAVAEVQPNTMTERPGRTNSSAASWMEPVHAGSEMSAFA